MSVNMGQVDRVLRAVLGAILLYLAFFGGVAALEAGVLKWLAVLVGVVMLGTAALGTCPAYTLFGIRTCRR